MADAYVWKPTQAVVDYSNIGRFIKRHGITGYHELVARSTADVDWFWNAVIEDLGIEFFRPFDALLDTSSGVPWSRWFVGGQVNLAHNCVDRHARSARRDHLALIWEGEDGSVRKLTYAELSMPQTSRLASALKRLGISSGDTVGLFLPMIPEAVVAFLGCAKIGAVAVPIFSGFGAQAVAARLNDARAAVLITADLSFRRGTAVPMAQVAADAQAATSTLRHVIVVRSRRGADNRPVVSGHLDWDDLLEPEPTDFVSQPLDPEAPLMIAYTSGTTGLPKGAVHVHGGFLVKIAQEVAHQVDMRDDDRLCWVTDLGWIMGPWELVGGLAAGGTVVLLEGAPDYPAADRLWSTVERHAITILGVSPTLVRALMR